MRTTRRLRVVLLCAAVSAALIQAPPSLGRKPYKVERYIGSNVDIWRYRNAPKFPGFVLRSFITVDLVVQLTGTNCGTGLQRIPLVYHAGYGDYPTHFVVIKNKQDKTFSFSEGETWSEPQSGGVNEGAWSVQGATSAANRNVITGTFTYGARQIVNGRTTVDCSVLGVPFTANLGTTP